MATKVVVELTPDEQRLLDAFNKATAADKRMRGELEKTGVVIESQNKAIANSMIRAANENAAGVDKIIRQLRRAGSEGNKVAKGLEETMGSFGLAGRKSVDEIIEGLEKLDPILAVQARSMVDEFRAADKAEKFENTRAQLDALGGDFKVLGAEIKRVLEAPQGDAIKSAQQIVEELRQIDPSKAEQIALAMDRARDAINETRLQGFLTQLSGGTDEAQKLAKVLGEDIKIAAFEAEGGIDGIAQKILALRPELKSSVDQWRSEMTEAAKFGEGAYAKALNALREGGPVGKKVAEQIKKELVASGQIVEKTFEDMVRPLEKMDPKMAEAARKMHKHLQKIEGDGKGAFSRFKESAIAQITGVASAYIGIQEAVQLVTESLREQQEVLRNAADKHKDLAAVMQEARKNLADLSEEQQNYFLQTAVKRIAGEESFSDLGSLAKAFGTAVSAGATTTNLEDIVQAAAALTGNTTEFVDETASALVDISRATGEVNAQKNASLAFLIGKQARVVDPTKIFRNAPPALVTAANQASQGKEREAALQGGALFAALTRLATDPTGDASSTATIQFIRRLDEFFDNLGKDATEATQKLAALKQADALTSAQQLDLNTLRQNKANQVKTDAQIATLQQQIQAIQSQQDTGLIKGMEAKQLSVQKRKLKEQLASISQSEFTAADQARLDDLESRILKGTEAFNEEKRKLESQIKLSQFKGLAPGTKPGTLGEQLETLRQSPDLAKLFLQEKFGEQRFRAAGQQLIFGGDVLDDYRKTLRMLQQQAGSTQLFFQQVERSRTGSPQEREAFAQRQFETARNVRLFGDSAGAQVGQFREELIQVLRENRSSGFRGVGQTLGEFGIGLGILEGREGPEEIVSGVRRLLLRRAQLRAGGVSELEAPRIRNIEQAIGASMMRLRSPAARVSEELTPALRRTQDLIRRSEASVLPPQFLADNIDVLRRMEAILERQLEIQENTEMNTRARPRRTSDAMRQGP